LGWRIGRCRAARASRSEIPSNGRTITVPVVDRGPYVAGRQWDLTGGLCVALDHCYTGPIYWKFA